jgi:hypothetical protein
MIWRVGRKVPINVYDGGPSDRPVCQCHTEEDARLIVNAVNAFSRGLDPERLDLSGIDRIEAKIAERKLEE